METVDSKIFQRICRYLEPADVFRLEATSTSLQVILRNSEAVWTRFRQARLLPPPPECISHLATDKTIMRLTSSPRCCSCLNRGSVIDWVCLKRACPLLRNQRQTDAIDLKLPGAVEWIISIRSFTQTSCKSILKKRTLKPANLEDRKSQLYARFASLEPVAISAQVLDDCALFQTILGSHTVLCESRFKRILKSISGQVLTVRRRNEVYDRVSALKLEAMLLVPGLWKEVVSTDDAALVKLIKSLYSELEDTEAYSIFPPFSLDGHRVAARKIWIRCFDEFSNACAMLTQEYPCLNDVAFNLAQDRAIRKMFSDPTKSFSIKKNTLAARLLKNGTQDRLDLVFPFPEFYFNFNGTVFSAPGFGLSEWFDRHRADFDFQNQVWNPTQLRESRKEWQNAMSARISSVYCYIQENCSTEILEEALDSEKMELEELMQSPEWNAISHLPPVHLVNIRFVLKELLDSWFQFTPGQRFRQLDSLAAECRGVLTKAPSEYEESNALTKVLDYFNQAVYERRSIKLLGYLYDVPCFAGVRYLQCHQIHVSDDIDYENEALKFADWLAVVKDNLSQLVAQLDVGHLAGESYSMQKLLFEISGEGTASSFEIGRGIWRAISPSDTTFSAADFMKDNADLLSALVASTLAESDNEFWTNSEH
ncbi:hypothetical protein HDU78_003317 [Chytriomyces hyalinus]|nr:hypothetical protein HDU78_003317 [Chytriomyces hyalinus]